MSCWLLLSAFGAQIAVSTLTTGQIGCFADVSSKSDRKTDIAIYNGDIVSVFKQSLAKKDTAIMDKFNEYANFDAGNAVQSVSSMDWNTDGIADLFVVTQAGDTFDVTLWIDTDGQYEKSAVNITGLADPTVLVVDANADFYPDVFGKRGNQEGFWFRSSESSLSQFVPLVTADQGRIAMDSVALIDLDQDCIADLVYIVTTAAGTRVVNMISGPSFGVDHAPPQTLLTLSSDQMLKLFFADINKDGAMDIIIPEYGTRNVHVWIQSSSLDFKQLCEKQKPVQFDDDSAAVVTLDAHSGHVLSAEHAFIVQDFDMDSMMNIATVMVNSSSHQTVFVTTLDGKNKADLDGAQLKLDSVIASLFTEFVHNDISDIAFFHSGSFPNGVYILVQRADNSLVMVDLSSKISADYGFISVCPLNNVSPRTKYGGTMPGVTVKAFFRSRKGVKIYLSGSTLYQTNSRNHQLPFLFFGLGNPESYIEKLVIRYPQQLFTQPGVPPNSQLVLFADGWKLQTFLAPYLTWPKLAIIIAVVMVLLGSAWIYLEMKEKKTATDAHKDSTTTNNFFF